MFNKKRELPKLSYFILRVNLAAIAQWLPNRRKIEPTTPDKNWNRFDTKEYKITIFPTEPFTFYHNMANEFSHSINGLDTIENEHIGCFEIEWSWNQSYFFVTVSYPRVPIFAVPIDEMLHLLKTGKNLSKDTFEDEEVIKLGSEKLFDEIHRSRFTSYSLAYSNELVSLTLVYSNPGEFVNY